MLLLDFGSPALLDAPLAGGKGANLARLTQGGFPVPPGFVLPPDAYRAFLLFWLGFVVCVWSLPLGDAAGLERACQALCAEMACWPIPDTLHCEVESALAQFGADSAFSVRSSATAEDLGGAAFAGQHETYLNCIGIDPILARIRDCWISLWSARAVSYRLQAGIGLLDTAIAVVVQKMAFSRVAGGGGGGGPGAGGPAEQSVDANYGLGESVVGGEFPVDHWLLDKASGQVRKLLFGQAWDFGN